MVTPVARWKSAVVDTIGRFASEDDQRRNWLGPDAPEPTTPVELLATLFDDYDFDDFIESTEVGLSEAARKAADEFRVKLLSYADNWIVPPDPSAVVDDPAWQDVRVAADKFLRNLETQVRGE